MVELDVRDFGRRDGIGRPGVTSTIGSPPSLCAIRRREPALRRSLVERVGSAADPSARLRQLGEGLLLVEPGLVVRFVVDHDAAAHVGMADAAELGAQDLEACRSGSG